MEQSTSFTTTTTRRRWRRSSVDTNAIWPTFREMFRRGLVQPSELQRLFEAIVPQLVRYPPVDAQLFEHKVAESIAEVGGDRHA